MCAASLFIALSACLPTEGLLLERRDAGSSTAPPRRVAAVRANMTLQYQITGGLDLTVDAELFIVDLFETDASAVARLHERGAVVVAYVSVGSLERWRSDASLFPQSAVGESLAPYPDESWLDVRRPEVRGLMEARLDRALAKGFDGIFASTLGGASRSESGLDLTADDELAYARFLAAAAHERGLDIGFAADLPFFDALERDTDFTVAIDCVRSGSCAALAARVARGLPVFDLETMSDRTVACAQAAEHRIAMIFKHPWYDAYRQVCP